VFSHGSLERDFLDKKFPRKWISEGGPMRPSLLRDVTQRILVVYRRFATAYRFHRQGSGSRRRIFLELLDIWKWNRWDVPKSQSASTNLSCVTFQKSESPNYIAAKAWNLVTLLRGHRVHLNLDHLISSYEGAEKMLFTSYYCRPHCRNLLRGYELLQLQSHVRWSHVYGLNLNKDLIHAATDTALTKNLWIVEYGSQEKLDFVTYQNTLSFPSRVSYFLSNITLNLVHFVCSSSTF